MTDRHAAGMGLSILQDMMTDAICIHDDWNDVLGEQDWDQFDTNPMLLGARTCIMHRPIGFGERYLDALGRLNCLPREIISPERRSRSVSRDLLSDPNALSAFRKALSASPTLSTYYSYRNLGIEHLISLPGRSVRCIPPVDEFERLIERSTSYLLMERAGIPVPVADFCTNAIAVLRFLESANRSGFEAVLLKDHHRKTHRIASAGELASIESSIRFPVLVERIYSVVESPVCQSIAYRGRSGHLFTLNQTVSAFHYEGNSSPLKVERSIAEQIQEYNQRIGQAMPAYEGVFGVDYIVTPAGEVMAVDLNPRFNSSTYPYVFLERQSIDVSRSHTRFRLVTDCPLPDLSYLLAREDFPAFEPGRGSGVFVFNPVPDLKWQGVSKWSAISVAATHRDLEDIEAAFAACLTRVRPPPHVSSAVVVEA